MNAKKKRLKTRLRRGSLRMNSLIITHLGNAANRIQQSAWSNNVLPIEFLTQSERIAIQRALKIVCIYNGRIDGIWSTKTNIAVRRFAEYSDVPMRDPAMMHADFCRALARSVKNNWQCPHIQIVV